MKMKNLNDLFMMELRDMYGAEKMVLKALPKMAKAASAEPLKAALQQHLKETERQIERLEKVFSQAGAPARAKKCKGMQGVLEEGQEIMEEDAEPSVRDAGLIGAAQRVEHYEMAGYGCLRTYARLLGNEQAARLFEETLGEEKHADLKLTELAERGINLQARDAGEEEEEDNRQRKAA